MKWNRVLLYVTIAAAITLPGCRLEQNLEITLDNELITESDQKLLYGEQLQINDSAINQEELFPLLFQVSKEEAARYMPAHYQSGNLYIKDAMELMISENMMAFYDETDGAGSCYSNVCNPCSYLREYQGYWQRDLYPEENLENLTKEEVIEICQPYANACGYQNSDVTVYAMTLESLNNAAEIPGGISAPGAGFQYVSYEDIAVAKEENGEEAAEELRELRHSAISRQLPWEKEHEAMMLVYRPIVNHLVIESFTQRLVIVYVPALKKVVYMEGYSPVTAEHITEEKELISKEDAAEKAVMTLGLNSEDVAIENISMVYSIRAAQGGEWLEARTMNPCWRIDYRADKSKLPNESGTLLIDAFDGFVSSY